MHKWMITIGLALIIGSQTVQNYVQRQYMDKQQELVKAQAEMIDSMKDLKQAQDDLLDQQGKIITRIIELYVKEKE